MPTYEYLCEKCGVFELVQKISEDALSKCPNCGSNVTRLVSAPAFHLKGSGWYKTDYGSSTSSSGSEKATKSSTSDSSSNSSSSSSSDSSTSTPASSTATTSTTSSSD